MRQIFGFTETSSPAPGHVVQHMAVHEADHGDVKITLRRFDGAETLIHLPQGQRDVLALALHTKGASAG